MQKIIPFMWIKQDARGALDFYTKLFPNSKVTQNTPIDGAPGPKDQFVANFELLGQSFMLIQGGENPMLQASGPLSLTVLCDTQEEIDTLWDAFSSDGGMPIACGWIKDRYGITWQVVPAKMGELMGGDPEKAKRVGAVMFKMMKIDIAALEAAARG